MQLEMPESTSILLRYREKFKNIISPLTGVLDRQIWFLFLFYSTS